jgi:SAM-dependent methyltransferase
MGSRTWFDVPGARGDRTLAQQLTGLERLWPLVRGQDVLDVGCAEGLIGIECVKAGAAGLTGIEVRADAVRKANDLASLQLMTPDRFIAKVGDAQTYLPPRSFDVVLLLAVLHKLPRPSEAFARYLSHCDRLCVVRLRQRDWPVLRDARSGNKPFDLGSVAKACGFRVDAVTDGPKVGAEPPEWCGWLVRERA